jgi:hypothetical protein
MDIGWWNLGFGMAEPLNGAEGRLGLLGSLSWLIGKGIIARD